MDDWRTILSLKLTASSHLKTDDWKTILSFWGPAYFQGRAVSFRQGNDPSPQKKPEQQIDGIILGKGEAVCWDV